MKRNLENFHSKFLLKTKLKAGIWWLIQNTFFPYFLIPSSLRVITLRLFGAKIGKSVYIRRGVRVHFPWNLSIGNNSWIGEGVWFINHVLVTIESNVCISQDAIICSSGHDLRSPSLDYKHSPITIKRGSWVCLRANVLAGSTMEENSVLSAGQVLRGVLPRDSIMIDNEVKKINY